MDPRLDLPGESEPHREDVDIVGPTVGQIGSSTRRELMAWIVALSKPIRSMYATDSAAMLCKARQLLQKAAARQQNIDKGRMYREGCPFKMPWGCKPTGTFGR